MRRMDAWDWGFAALLVCAGALSAIAGWCAF